MDQATPLPIDHLALMGKPDAPALVLREGVLSYAMLDERVAGLAGWLAVRYEEGERVASWAAKGELTCLLPLAAARAGLVHVPINPLLKHAQVAYILADSGARLLLGTQARLATLESADVPESCEVIAELDAIAQSRASQLRPGASEQGPENLAAILYTSGSTGQPKGVMLSHANMWLGAVSVAQYLKLADDDVTLAVLPLSFDYGQNQLLSTWYVGGSVVPLDYLFPRDVAKACARHGVTTLAAVPPLWWQLVGIDWPDDARTPLRRLTNSGGALTTELVNKLRQIFPQADLYPMYGLTEAFRSTYLDPQLVDAHPTSMGRGVPFAEILVVDEQGDPVLADEEGELVHCGPLVAQGYWQDPVRTAERFRPAPAHSNYGGTAVWSGDRVVRNQDGLLFFVGRRDAMIKSAGNRISPQEIEDAAVATGLVADAVALGAADERLGQAVVLFVRSAPGVQPDEEALTKALARELPNFMQPRSIFWREELPINPNGKIDRAALANEIRA